MGKWQDTTVAPFISNSSSILRRVAIALSASPSNRGVQRVFGYLRGVYEDIALYQRALAVGRHHNAHVPRRMAGGVDGADFVGEVGVSVQSLQDAGGGERLYVGVHVGKSLRGLHFWLSEVVEIGLVNHVPRVGKRGDVGAVALCRVPAHVIEVQVG